MCVCGCKIECCWSFIKRKFPETWPELGARNKMNCHAIKGNIKNADRIREKVDLAVFKRGGGL